MSRKNYRHCIHEMDSFIGKPFYSNVAGAVIDPNTGLEVRPALVGGDDKNLVDYLNPYNISMEGLASPDMLSSEQIREGATPEISQEQIDAAKVAQFKFNEEMGKRIAEREARLKAEAEEELRTREARNQYAIEQNRLTDLRIAQEKADKEAKIEAEYQAGIKAQKIEADRIAEAQKLAQIEAQKQAGLNSPIIVVPPSYVAPPLIIGGGGGGGGGSMGGGEPEPSSKPMSTPSSAKPSFLKKNFIPLLFVASAIFVFIKKPIK